MSFRLFRLFHFAPHFRSCDATAAAGEHRQPRSPQAPAAANIMSGRTISGGIDNRSPAYGARNTYRADLLTSFPAGSILESTNTFDALAEVSPTIAVAQATIDFLKVFFAIALVAVTGVGLGVAVFYFLFL